MAFQFNQVTLDTDQYRLSRAGEPVAIEPQVFDLLVYLIEHRDRVVTRDELLDSLWHGKVVTDSALGARLKDARKAVGDNGTRQQVIKTFHGRGYRFIAKVIESGNSSAADNQASSVNHQRDKPAIVVLQFANLSGDPLQEYFCEGMTMNISAQLSRIRSLQIKQGFNIDLAETSPTQLAQDLGVDYVLSGSILREDDHVRVFVELTDCWSGEIRWAETFDRNGSKVIDIQDEITTAITGSLWSYRGVIRDAARENLTRKSTQDFNAFDLTLKGVHHKEKATREDLQKSHRFLNRARELDPECAEAFAWSAWAHIVSIFMGWGNDHDSSPERAISLAREANSIDPFSEVGHWALGAALVMQRDYDRGFEQYDKAMEINPSNPDFMVTKGRDLACCGRGDEGVELVLRGFKYNHHHAEWYFWYLAMAYFGANRLQDAIESINRMNQQNKDTRIFLAASYALSESPSQARKQFDEIKKIDPEFALDEVKISHRYMNREILNRLLTGLRLAAGD